MANGYGVGLFDSKGPEAFATSIDKIVTSLTGVQNAFTALGEHSATAIGRITSSINDLTGKLTNLQSQMKQTTAAAGGGGGGGGMGGGARPSAAPSANGGSGGTGAAGDGIWLPPSARDGFAGDPLSGMKQDTASAANPPSMTRQDVPQGSTADAENKRVSSQVRQGGSNGQGGGNFWAQAAATLGPAAAGSAARFVQGAGASMISTAVQGATIGQMEAPAFGVSARSLYVIPGGTLAQAPGDYAQANYYAMMNMGVAPGTGNWSTVQRGANQLMTLVPGMSRQGAMQAQNQLQQPGTINRALAVGLNLRPGGQLQTPEQQYAQIFNRLTMGGQVNAKTFAAMMQPGAPGQVNLSAIGIDPGSDAYYGFMQYAYTRLGLQSKGKTMPDVGTTQGAKQAGLDTPYYAQLQAQSSKSQLESKMEPGIASAAKTLNEAATKLLNLVNPLGSLLGSGIGGLGKVFGGITSMIPGLGGGGGLLKMLTGGMFQAGGLVEGPLNQAMLAIVHGGERILTPGMLGGGSGIAGAMTGGLGSLFGGVFGGIKDLFGHLFGGGGCGGGGGGGGSGGSGGWHNPFGGIGSFFSGLPGRIGGDISGFGHRIGGDISGVLKDIPGIGALFGGSVFGIGGGLAHRAWGDATSLFHRGTHDVASILKEIPGLGELFGGSAFGAAGGLVHGAIHKAGGLFHSIGHFGSSLFHGATKALGGLGHALGKGVDSVSDMLMGKLTDIPNTALHSLLSPVPADSVLAAATAKEAKPAAPTPQQRQPAPKQTTPQIPPHHKHKGILGGIGDFFSTAIGADVGLAKDLGSALGFPVAAAPAGKAPTPYTWSYQRGTGATPIDLSGMYANTGATSSQSSDGSGSGSGGSGGTGSGAPVNLTGSGNTQQAYNFFISKGLKDYMAAGILGNLAQESGVNPTSKQAGGPGTGIAQWSNPGRWTDLVNWAKPQNLDPNALATQLGFIWQELTGSYKGALSALQSSKDVSGATQAFEQLYEIAGTPDMGNRLKYAQNVLASKGAGYARGTQLIARNQLAMLHRGEAVIAAADNYSASPYNKGGSGGGTSVNLNFKAGSIVLQVPPNTSQRDMENIANQFVQAISKPQLLASARSK